MKIISSQAHGVFDYLLVIFLAMAPLAVELTGPYAVACYVLAGAYLLVVLATDSPMGLGHLIPYRVHGGMELVSGVAFLASPFLFGFATANPTARTFFMVFGGALLLLWVCTDWSGKAHSEMGDDSDPTHNLKGESLLAPVEQARSTRNT